MNTRISILLVICLIILVSCNTQTVIFNDGSNYDYFDTNDLIFPKNGDTVRGDTISLKFVLEVDSNMIQNSHTGTIGTVVLSNSPFFDEQLRTFFVNLSAKDTNRRDTVVYKIPINRMFPANVYYWKYYKSENNIYKSTRRLNFCYEK